MQQNFAISPLRTRTRHARPSRRLRLRELVLQDRTDDWPRVVAPAAGRQQQHGSVARVRKFTPDSPPKSSSLLAMVSGPGFTSTKMKSSPKQIKSSTKTSNPTSNPTPRISNPAPAQVLSQRAWWEEPQDAGALRREPPGAGVVDVRYPPRAHGCTPAAARSPP